MCQGLTLTHSLERAANYTEKRDLLNHALDYPGLSLAMGLAHSNAGYPDDYIVLSKFSEAELEIFKGGRAKDLDHGPYQTWHWVHQDQMSFHFTLVPEYECLRRRAYVMWDQERITRHKMLDAFRQALNSWEGGDFPTLADYEEMRESFHARSLIWAKGGRGYWSKGDESRIEWPR
jgi:hypothetical protein